MRGSVRPRLSISERLESRRLLSGQVFPGEGPGTEFGPGRFVVADFNGDNKPDLATADQFNTVSIALNDGRGGFGASTPIVVGSGPIGITSGDFNADGKVDLAVALSQDDQIGVLLGTGSGTFAPVVTYSTNEPVGFNYGETPWAIVIADFNGDGKLDLAATCIGGSSRVLSRFLGVGNGTFGAVSNTVAFISDLQGPTGLVTGDFNGDGKADLVVASQGGPSSLSLLPGTGNGLFGSRQTLRSGTNGGTGLVLAGDINGDGKLDLIDGSGVGSNINILKNNGTGTFTTTTLAVGLMPFAGALADYTGDGKLDLAIVDNNGVLHLLTGSGTGTFAQSGTLPTGAGANWTVAADFDGDGNLDIATSTYSGDGVSITRGLGGGTFAAAGAVTTSASNSGPTGIVTGDFDHNGHADLLVANNNLASLSLFEGTGTGAFATAPVNTSVSSRPNNLVTGDFNSDGNLDVAVDYSGVTQTVTILLGDGDGTFTATAVLTAGANPGQMTLGDFNNDGKADLAVALNNTTSAAVVFLGNGAGNFGTALDVAAGTLATGIGAADFNQDGKTDLVVANSTNTILSVVFGNGNGTFGAPTTLNVGTGFNTGPLVVTDLNNDGLPDVASASNTTSVGLVAVFLSTSPGEFGAVTRYAAGRAALSIGSGDFDGDGRQDLVVGNSQNYAATVTMLYGQATGGFRRTTAPSAGTYPMGIAVGDYDGDGKPDLVAANNGTNNIGLLINRRQNVGPIAAAGGALTIGAIAGGVTVTEANGVMTLTSGAGVDRRLAGSITAVTLDTNASAVVNSDLGQPGSTGSVVLLVRAGGTLTFNSTQHIGGLNLVGTAAMTPGVKLLRLRSLSILPTGRLDLNDSDLLYDYVGTSQQSVILGLLAKGRTATGAWNGLGISSTAAAAAGNTAFGILSAAQYQSLYGATAAFHSEGFDGTTVLVKYTLYGDTDFDGGVSINDFNRLSAAFGATGKTWLDGDLDYDGGVSINDFNLLAGNFGKTMAAAAARQQIKSNTRQMRVGQRR